MPKQVVQDQTEPELEAQVAHYHFAQVTERILDSLVEVPGCTDRYIIYSEKDGLIVVAAIDPKKPNGAFTLVKILPMEFRTFDSWKMPSLVVTTLRGYLDGFIKDIKKRTHAQL